MKAYFVLLLSLITCYSFSQEVQWATEVIEYSSQFSARDFSAIQATGPPNVLNLGGKDSKAWMASAPDNLEYLVLGFGSLMKIRQIAIVESSNPGAISLIYVYDENDVMHLVGEFIPAPTRIQNRLLNVFLPVLDFNVKAVKIVIDGSKVPGANSIDAVGVSNSVVPIRFGEGFAFRTNPRLSRKTIDLKASGKESDIRPVYSVDEHTLFFTRGYSEANEGGVNDPGDVWYSTYNERNGQYSEPVRLNNNINNIGFNTSNAYYNYNGNPRLMVGNVSGNPKKVKANLSMVEKKDGDWSTYEVQNIKSKGEIPVDADYTIADNGKVLIISTELRESEGGTDLYVSYNEGGNKWSAPVNLTVLNTPEDEYAPFFSAEENALYFTSKGYNGLGGSDIYRVKRLDDGWNNWGEPENIGEDINTELNDHYFYFDDQDSYAYLAQSSRDDVMKIVRIERPRFMDENPLVVVKGKVLDKDEATPVTALLSLLIQPQNEIYGVTFPDENSGNYQIFLRSGYKYILKGEKAGYRSVEMPVTLENKQKPYTYDLNIFLSKELSEAQPELASELSAIGADVSQEEEKNPPAEPVKDEPVPMPVIVAAAPGIQEEAEEPPVVEETEEVRESEEMVVPSVQEEVSQTVPEETPAVPEETPAVPGKETVRKTGSVVYSELQNLVVFDFDSDIILPPSFPILEAIITFMKRHGDLKLEIGGFTDYIGDYYYNIDLSKRRAYSVRAYLIDGGIEKARVKILGFGEKMPVVANMESEWIKLNRRAEFNFTRY